MWEEILKTALGNGLWAVLFCVLLMYQLRDGRVRENKYRYTINVLLDKLELLQDVRQQVRETLVLLKKREKKTDKKTDAEAAASPDAARVRTEALRV